MHVPVLIIGGGPAGYTAGIYAARANLSPMLVEGIQPGGQLTITTDVENYPGFAEPIMGPELMIAMRAQAEAVGCRIESDIVTDLDIADPFVVTLDSGRKITADTVILATGARAKWLGNEPDALMGRGISGCATCDGAFFRNQDVAVIGGGNTAVEEALYLSNIARSVTLVHRRDSLRAEQVLQDRLMRRENITIRWNSVVDEFRADNTGGLGSLALRDVQTDEIDTLEVTGAFVAIGHAPVNDLVAGKLELTADGYVVVAPGTASTAVPGLYAAGDIADPIYRQAVTAAAMGCMAALDAERFLNMSR